MNPPKKKKKKEFFFIIKIREIWQSRSEEIMKSQDFLGWRQTQGEPIRRKFSRLFRASIVTCRDSMWPKNDNWFNKPFISLQRMYWVFVCHGVVRIGTSDTEDPRLAFILTTRFFFYIHNPIPVNSKANLGSSSMQIFHLQKKKWKLSDSH